MVWQFETILVEFRRRPGPRSVMVSREELGYENMSEESGEESDPAAILKLPNGMRYRSTFSKSLDIIDMFWHLYIRVSQKNTFFQFCFVG